jgi:hypothetical protein
MIYAIWVCGQARWVCELRNYSILLGIVVMLDLCGTVFDSHILEKRFHISSNANFWQVSLL